MPRKAADQPVLHPLVLIGVGSVIATLGFMGVQQHRKDFPPGWKDTNLRGLSPEDEVRHSLGQRSYVTAASGVVFLVGGVLQLLF